MVTVAVETYLAVRRAAGFQLTPVATDLHRFARFATERGQPSVTTPTVMAWAPTAASEAQRHTRLRAGRRFAHVMHAADPRHEIPPATLFCGRRQRPRPYIFTAADLQDIMDYAPRLGPPGSRRPPTYRPLFGLLAATGRRPSEARARPLHALTPAGLIIRESKFKKSRW
jgi:integrase